MIIGILFWLLAILCCGHAILFGGRDGRWAAGLIVAAALLTAPATLLGEAWGRTELMILAVDTAFLVSLYILMLASPRFWPIWMTGFHLVAVVTHLATLLVPAFTPAIYRALGSMWAIPVLLSLLIGVELDRRSETAAPRAD